MKKFELGRTLIETLAVIAIIGILSVSGLQLYSKAMNTIRANYIIEQVYIKANELIQNPVASRHKTVDIAMNNDNLAYGYQFDASSDSVSSNAGKDVRKFTIKMNGYFTPGIEKILNKRLKDPDYAWIKDISKKDLEAGKEQLSFSVSFAKKKTVRRSGTTNQGGGSSVSNGNAGNSSNKDTSCDVHAVKCDPLICDEASGYYEFEDELGKCQPCPAGYFCE